MIVSKIRGFIQNKFNGLTKSKEVMRVVRGALLIIVFFILLYSSSWIYVFTNASGSKERVDMLTELRMFVALLISGGTITALGALVKMLFDDDGDGIPDFLENNSSDQLLGQVGRLGAAVESGMSKTGMNAIQKSGL